MKKFIVSLMALIGLMLFTGCFGSKYENAEKGVNLIVQENERVALSTKSIYGGVYEISPAVSEAMVVAGEGVLVIVKEKDGKTEVAVTGTDGNISQDELLFKIKGEQELKSVKLVEEVSETNFAELQKKASEKARTRGTKNIFRTLSTNMLLGDFNSDNTVDIKDFALFVSNYGGTNALYDIGPAQKGTDTGWTDIYSIKNSDGAVDILDLIVFGKNYGKTYISDITVTGETQVKAGSSIVLTANKSVTWQSSNTAIATLSPSTGTTTTVTGVAAGAVEIVASADGKTKSYLVDVLPKDVPTVTAVEIAGNSSVDAGKTLTLTATVKYSDGTSKSEAVEWTTSDATVATVTPAVGTSTDVAGVKGGTVTITAAKDGKSITKTVTVNQFSGIVIYVEKPTAWSEIWIWYDADLTTAAWDTTTLKKAPGDLVNYRTGWYKKELPGKTAVKFAFNDGTWNNKMQNSATSADFSETKTCWVTKDGKVQYTDPQGPTPPKVTSGKYTGGFTTDGVNITLYAEGTNVTKGKYTVDGTDPATNGIEYTNGTVVKVGTGLSVGQSVTLKLYATNGTETATATYTYTKEKEVVLSNDFNDLRMYQVMVATFMDGDGNTNFPSIYGNNWAGGDLDGVIKSIDYIKGLGMNAIWLTPIFESNGNTKLDATGYFCQDYFKVDDNWGGNNKLKELVTAAHDAGLYVILDGVFGHHKGSVPASPSGYTVAGGTNPVSYPGSLNFYKEVATWWIENYEIDGWRLDQAYQVATGPHDGKMFQDKNYWQDIRKAVETTCSNRKLSGKQWGTLGYMVGEIWDGGGTSILTNGYTGYNGEKGLLSCFDFPGRYKLVQTLAVEESKAGNGGDASVLNGVFSTPDKISGVYPNMFLTNHDVLRFGDLVQRGGLSNYWERYKAAMSFVAAYTGPITVYYGDEWGAETAGYVNKGDLGYYDDNCSRSAGKISGFSSDEQSMVTYSTQLMNMRKNHPALWRGTRTNIIASGQQYADLKTDATTGEKIVYLLNTKSSSTTFNIAAAGSSFTDAITGATVSSSSVTVEGFGSRFLIVK